MIHVRKVWFVWVVVVNEQGEVGGWWMLVGGMMAVVGPVG